jgi:hypothetical protein
MTNRAAIVRTNLADAAAVTASSWLTTALPSRLQNPHTLRRWQGTSGSSEWISATFSTNQSIDSIALLKCAKVVSGVESTMTEAATVRIRVSSVDPTGVAGDLYDSGAITNVIDSQYECLVKLLSAPVSAKAVRIDLTETADALEAGRLVIGLREQLSWNFAYGAAYGFGDNSRLRKSAGGQTFVDRDDKYRVLSVTFEMLQESERYDLIQEIDRLNGISDDILFITNPDSTELPRDTLWGLIKDMNPPTQPYFDIWQKSYQIEERL